MLGRMRLTEITDPLARALLDPTGCSDADYISGIKAGLLRPRASYGHGPTEAGETLLAAARRVAADLSKTMRATLEKACRGGWQQAPNRRTAMSVALRGLVKINPAPHPRVVEIACLPAGRLVHGLLTRDLDERACVR